MDGRRLKRCAIALQFFATLPSAPHPTATHCSPPKMMGNMACNSIYNNSISHLLKVLATIS